MVTVTRFHVHCNNTPVVVTTAEVSSHEKPDTVMIFHSVKLSPLGKTVHIITQDTDVSVLVLRRLPIFGTQFSLVIVNAKCCFNQYMTNLELQKQMLYLVVIV